MGDLKRWQKLALWAADNFPKNKLSQDLAYKIISDPKVGYQAGATTKDVARNVFSSKPKEEDTNKYMFVYGADTRRPETTIGQAYDWSEDIRENGYENVKTYSGVLNPYNEYLVDSRNKGLVEEFAKVGYSPVSNINNEYIDWNTYRLKQGTPYFDDVHGYRPTFHFDNGKPVISSSDLYDFGKNYIGDFTDLYVERSGNEKDPTFTMELQRRALNSVGQPYLLVQKNIPIRFVDNPKGNEIWRTNNFNRELRLDEMSDREISDILHTGYIEPAVVTAYKKGGRIHIKKKNRGKFTEYCGGKVTEECIAKGKKSKDPKIRKRATFAANARRWKHENGGVIGQFNIGGIIKAQDSAKLVSGYTTHDDDNLRNVETFNKNWLFQRDSQLAKQGLLDPEIKNNLNWWNRNMHVSNKKVANIIRNRLFSNLDETKEFSATSALKDRKGYQVLKNKLYADYPIFEWDGYDLIGPPKPLDPEILRHVFETSSAGIYSPEYRTIVYNEDFINTPTKIHERDHAMFAPINSEFSGVNAIDKETYRFKDWEVPERWGYYEDPLEVRARLMQMRFDNKLDPKHEYSDEEIESMRNDPNFKDYKIFERYNNEYIKFLLNDVAQNNMNENRFDYRSPINFAKNGGILKAQEGTGNLYAPHPLSPVGIALNQAKAMAKGKKDQQHLPPGVKEVVGPDGKKVAIRTEQPLQPLEQSIAEWLPGTGDVAEVGYIANDVKNGNYGSAALAAAMIALPGNAGKLLSKHRKAVSKTADAVEDAVRKADVSEYINTVDDALPERQPLTTNKSKQFWDGTSESKLTDAEKQGVPKGERNQPINVRTPSQEFSNKYISSKMVLRKPTYDYEDLTENYFRDVSVDEFNKRLKEYVSYARHKGSPITNEIAEPIVKGYRNYLHHLDFDAKDLSDDELRIILSKHFADLSRGASGKMKDQIVWHSSPTWFDEFDYRYTGKNMENSGAMGPGNYFSKEATMYGRGKKGEFSGKYDMGNTQPYIITDVISTPSGKDMQNKGLLPTIIHKYRGRDIYGQKWNPDPEFDIKLKAQIDAVPLNDNKMYVLEGTDSGFDKLYQTPFGLPGGELMIRRNTGIKSLYPHPSRFVRDADGFVHLIPVDWNDARVNFKKGGKL